MVQYRTFRNDDPPQLVQLWNECFQHRTILPLTSPVFLEYFLFAKQYFDPHAFWLAEDEQGLVGFALAGFGPNAKESNLDFSTGVICLIGVHPNHRRKGIGSELLKRCETYLTHQGATTLYAGPQSPLNPYTFGLLGGAQSPGFPDSEPSVLPFFESHGYASEQKRLIFQRDIEESPKIVDARFPNLRRDFDICLHMPMRTPVTWYQECVLGPVELMELTLEEKSTGDMVGRAYAWEMELFSNFWNEHAIGIYDLRIEESYHRRGLARFLISQMCEHFQEQYFTMLEMHVDADNAPGIALVQNLGFQQVESGILLVRSMSESEST